MGKDGSGSSESHVETKYYRKPNKLLPIFKMLEIVDENLDWYLSGFKKGKEPEEIAEAKFQIEKCLLLKED